MNERIYFAIMGVEFVLMGIGFAGMFMGGAKIQRLEMEVDCLCTANGSLEADAVVLTENLLRQTELSARLKADIERGRSMSEDIDQRRLKELSMLSRENDGLKVDVSVLEKELELSKRNDMEHDPITGKWTKKTKKVKAKTL